MIISKIKQLQDSKSKIQSKINVNMLKIRKNRDRRKSLDDAFNRGFIDDDLNHLANLVDAEFNKLNDIVIQDMNALDAINLILRPLELEAIND